MRFVTEDRVRSIAGWAPFIIRLAIAAVFMAHGAQKLFGAFGGPGISHTAMFMGKLGVHPPLFWAWVVAMTEFFGGLAILLGFLTRLAAIAIVVDMIVAIAVVHAKHGFFMMNGGFEYPLVCLLMALSLVFSGAGPYSIDRLIRWKY